MSSPFIEVLALVRTRNASRSLGSNRLVVDVRHEIASRAAAKSGGAHRRRVPPVQSASALASSNFSPSSSSSWLGDRVHAFGSISLYFFVDVVADLGLKLAHELDQLGEILDTADLFDEGTRPSWCSCSASSTLSAWLESSSSSTGYTASSSALVWTSSFIADLEGETTAQGAIELSEQGFDLTVVVVDLVNNVVTHDQPPQDLHCVPLDYPPAPTDNITPRGETSRVPRRYGVHAWEHRYGSRSPTTSRSSCSASPAPASV